MTPSQKPNLEHTFLGSKDYLFQTLLNCVVCFSLATQVWGVSIWLGFFFVSFCVALTITMFLRLRDRYRDKRPAVRDIWRPSMILMWAFATQFTLNFTCLNLAFWLAKSFNLDWPMLLYSAFVGPALFGSMVTLLILAYICAGGVNPLIDDVLRYLMGSQTYREIRDERDAPHPAT